MLSPSPYVILYTSLGDWGVKELLACKAWHLVLRLHRHLSPHYGLLTGLPAFTLSPKSHFLEKPIWSFINEKYLVTFLKSSSDFSIWAHWIKLNFHMQACIALHDLIPAYILGIISYSLDLLIQPHWPLSFSNTVSTCQHWHLRTSCFCFPIFTRLASSYHQILT